MNLNLQITDLEQKMTHLTVKTTKDPYTSKFLDDPCDTQGTSGTPYLDPEITKNDPLSDDESE